MSLNDAIFDWAAANGGGDATFGMKGLNAGRTQEQVAANGTEYNSGLLNFALDLVVSYLLQQDGFFLLQQDGFKIVL